MRRPITFWNHVQHRQLWFTKNNRQVPIEIYWCERGIIELHAYAHPHVPMPYLYQVFPDPGSPQLIESIASHFAQAAADLLPSVLDTGTKAGRHQLAYALEQERWTPGSFNPETGDMDDDEKPRADPTT